MQHYRPLPMQSATGAARMKPRQNRGNRTILFHTNPNWQARMMNVILAHRTVVAWRECPKNVNEAGDE